MHRQARNSDILTGNLNVRLENVDVKKNILKCILIEKGCKKEGRLKCFR
jgi:hypothetical protein